MKNIFLLILFFSLTTVTVAADVEVKIKGLKDKEVYLEAYNMSGERIKSETISCKNGSFICASDFKEPVSLKLIPSSGKLDTKLIRGVVDRQTMMITLHLRPGEGCKVKGECKDLVLTYSVEGSDKNSVIANLRTEFIEQYRYYDMEQEYFRDDRSKEERDSVYLIGEAIDEKQNLKKIAYIKAHTNEELSGLFLSEISNTAAKECYPMLTKEATDGMFKSQVGRKKWTLDLLDKAARNRVGAEASDFTLRGLDGKEIKLSSLRGQYVFLYFWGSWCRWCLQGVEHLNALKTKYEGKVLFVGIVTNDTPKTLTDCVKAHGILWESYFDKDINTGESVPFNYGVTGYPKKVLIDPDGKIAFIYQGAHDEFYGQFDEVMKGK